MGIVGKLCWPSGLILAGFLVFLRNIIFIHVLIRNGDGNPEQHCFWTPLADLCWLTFGISSNLLISLNQLMGLPALTHTSKTNE